MSRRQARDADGDAGFTLIEVLVAFFIAALALTTALRILGEGAGWARRGPEAAARLEEAASLIDTVIAAPHLGPGDQRGAFADGHPWRIRVTDVTARVVPGAVGRLLRIDLFTAMNGPPLLSTAALAPAGGR